jgi:cytochrome c oxidase assembly protein subunit 11
MDGRQRRPGLRTPLLLAGVAAMMLGAAYAAKPLYDAFCKATGYGGTTQRAAAGASEIRDRTITVRFDANTSFDAPVTFSPEQRPETLRLGENGFASFRVENLSDEPVMVVANFNVTPFKAGRFFQKIECFCFKEQRLEAGQAVSMPVVFYVDPTLADEPRLDDVREITLSYTLFRSVEEMAEEAERAAEDGSGAE